jgi:transglutaminase-like putative cysteine protease
VPQDAPTVLRRRTAYCTGTARLAVALLTAVGIEAREVPGYVYASAGSDDVRPGFHRWIEVRYPDRGWAFSDPLASQHFVPATYLRLAAESLEVAPPPGS